MKISVLHVRTCAVTAVLCFAFYATSSGAAGLNKCVAPDGKVSYQQGACPAEAAATQVAVEPSPLQQAAPATPEEAQRRSAAALELQRAQQRLEASMAEAAARPKAKRPKAKGRSIAPPRPSDVWDASIHHQVLRGMTKAEVRESLGSPTSVYTDSSGFETWSYDVFGAGTYRGSTYVFRGDQLDTWNNYHGH